MTRPFEQIIENLSALTIGTVESVSPNEIKVLLELEAPQSTALNTGLPTGFPRINSYVLVPNEVGAVVGMIVWLGVERSSFPKRKGLKDFDLIDLPFPLRKLALAPVGTLVTNDRQNVEKDALPLRLDRGVTAFPSVGDPVLLPTPIQLRSIIEASGNDSRVKIGTSPTAGGAKVTADPDKLFGRHLAVLGNTGSGKSCTVAGLIRWSLDAVNAELKRSSEDDVESGEKMTANARFIILDPNGEYETAFSDLKPRVFRVGANTRVSDPGHDSQTSQSTTSVVLPLQVPAWLWNGHEWAAFAAASERTQRPLLMRALRELRSSGATIVEDIGQAQLVRHFRLRFTQVESFVQQGPQFWGATGGKNEIGQNIRSIAREAERFLESPGVDASIRTSLEGVKSVATNLINTKPERSGFFPAWDLFDLQPVLTSLRCLCDLFPRDTPQDHYTEDTPAFFEISKLPDHLELLASMEGGNTLQHVATMTTRIRTMLQDQRLRPIIQCTQQSHLKEWLESYVGQDKATNGEIGIIDLALVPSDVINIVIAVIARMVFEAAQRHVKLNTKALPTVLVLEEAHTFINRHIAFDNEMTSAAHMCRQTFERISREGRKFGLGLVLSSQRPSELSQTVLGQCNTFILHRIVNDDDQKIVSRLVPDSLGGLLKELSSLPSQRAILLGWATPIPTLVDIQKLERRPRSEDPDFWDVWTLKAKRPIDWDGVARDWLNTPPSAPDSKTPRESSSDS